MKRYMLFAGEDYYPLGGMDDFIVDFDTLDEIKEFILCSAVRKRDWFMVYDLEAKETVLYEKDGWRGESFSDKLEV